MLKCFILILYFVVSTASASELNQKYIKKLVSPNLIELSDGSVFAIKGVYIDSSIVKYSNVFFKKIIYIKDLLLEKEKNRYLYSFANIVLKNNLTIQEFLVSEGFAYVYYVQNLISYNEKLFNLEQQARKYKKGLWSKNKILSPYEVKDNIKKYINNFFIIKGKVFGTYKGKKFFFVNFEKDWKKDASILISVDNLKNFKQIDFEKLKNKEILVRGWVEYYNGPLVKVTNPSHLQVINEKI